MTIEFGVPISSDSDGEKLDDVWDEKISENRSNQSIIEFIFYEYYMLKIITHHITLPIFLYYFFLVIKINLASHTF